MSKKPKFQIVSDPRAEASGADCIICFRVTELPIPSVVAKIAFCTGCSERVWFADSSPRGIPIKCYQCAADLIAAQPKDEEIVYMATRKQFAEVTAYRLASLMKKKKT